LKLWKTENFRPEISVELRYAGSNHFTGKRIDEYEADRCILTAVAANALKGVQAEQMGKIVYRHESLINIELHVKQQKGCL
jgi:D-alanyl-D-alanine dipeptidase